METDKDHIDLLVKSEPKVSTLAIILKLKQETTIRYGIWSDGILPQICRKGVEYIESRHYKLYYIG